MIDRTAHAITSAVLEAAEFVFDYQIYISCDIVSSRTRLVQQALETTSTHILFIDSDMLFPRDVITQLLAHKKDIVGVKYNKREFPLVEVSKPLEKAEETLYQAQYVGFGLVLINLDVFRNEKLKLPWFNFGRDDKGGHIMGEDVWFCYTARDAGYEVWIDPTIKMGHVGEYAY